MKTTNTRASAFISSTFLDLYGERRAIEQTLNEQGILVNALDSRPASNNSSKKEIISGIKESDFTILILANRYGTIDASFTLNPKISITEWEYNLSRLSKKPVIAFIKHPQSAASQREDDKDSLLLEKQEKLKNFKNVILKNHSPQYFVDIEDLQTKLRKSIVNVYREHIAKITKEKDNLADQLKDIESRLEAGNKFTTSLSNSLKEAQSKANLGLGAPTYLNDQKPKGLLGLTLSEASKVYR